MIYVSVVIDNLILTIVELFTILFRYSRQ